MADSVRRRGTERALILASALSSLGTGLTIPFLLVYLSDVIGLGLARTTLILAIPGMAALALIALTGPVIDAVGSRSYAFCAASLSLVGSLLLAASTASTAPLAIVGAVAVPVGVGAFAPAFQAQIGLALPADRHAWFFSLQGGIANALLGVGGLAASTIVSLGGLKEIRWLFVADAASFGLLAMFAARHFIRRDRSRSTRDLQGEPDPGTPGRRIIGGVVNYLASLTTPLRDARFARALTMTFAVTIVGLAQFEFAFPAYAAQNAAALIGVGFAVNAVVGAIFQLVVAKHLVGVDLPLVITAAAVTWAGSWACLGLLGAPTYWARLSGLLLFAVLFGVAEALVIASVPAIVLNAADSERLGSYMAFNSIVFQSGRMAAPLLLASVTLVGREIIPIAFAALSLALIPVVRHGFTSVDRSSPDSQEVSD
jgi:MFS family permease